MSFDAAAAALADHLLEQEFVEVFAHHDADGIAAASILCHALFRAGGQFRLRIRPRITSEDLPADAAVLLCDFGSGLADLPADVMVVDHHVPHFEGEYHVNPRLAGIDGDREMSAAGAAYQVAQHIGDNRDLVGLAVLGIIGDGQDFTGQNRDIIGDGIANGYVAPRRGLRLAGRSLTEQLALAVNPYLDGFSGNEAAVRSVIATCSGDEDLDLETLLSLVLLKVSPHASVDAMCGIYGNTYGLGREVLDEAHSLAALIDACGKAGAGDIGASLCLRSTAALPEAWEIAVRHRHAVIDAIGNIRQPEDRLLLFEVENGAVISDVADALASSRSYDAPVFVIGPKGDRCSVSARCPAGVDVDLEALVRRLAGECGGHGGGHARRAGAVIPQGQIGRFRASLAEAVAA